MNTPEQIRDTVDQAVPDSYTGSEFAIVLRNGADGKSVEMAGVARPEQFDGTPAHVVGSFICTNFDTLAKLAAQSFAAAGTGEDGPDDTTPKVIGPDRERVILLPGTPV